MDAAPGLVVLHAASGPALEGLVFELTEDAVTVGRSTTCDVTVPHRTVSRVHARLLLAPHARLEAVTTHSGTFVNGEVVAPGDVVPLPLGSLVQVGSVVLQYDRIETVSATAPVPTPARPRMPAIVVRLDLGNCLVSCGGRDTGLTGDTARFLGVLAQNTGHFVSYADLRDAGVTTRQLAPLASTVRAVLARLMRQGFLDEALVRRWLVDSGVDVAVAPDRGLLSRRLLDNRTGYGYRLRIPEDAVCIEHVD